MVAQEHHFVVTYPDRFKKRIAVPEGPVGKGEIGLVNTYQVPVQYAEFVLWHSGFASGIQSLINFVCNVFSINLFNNNQKLIGALIKVNFNFGEKV